MSETGRHILNFGAELCVGCGSMLYGAEGINVPLMILPTRLIAKVLARYGARVGDRVRFHSPVTIHNACETRPLYYRNLQVGSDCYLGRQLFLDLQDRIRIEDNVTVSHRVTIITHTDAGTSPLKDRCVATSQAPVIIRQGAYVGANVTILQGVEIGACAVVGAGAVVAQTVPPCCLAAGVPAKVVKKIES